MKKALKNLTVYSILISIVSVAFVGCKKGDKDPFISLHTRKARVVGDWKVSKYSETQTTSYNGSSTTTTFDGNTFNYTQGSYSSSYKGTWTFSFRKDGTFSMDRIAVGGSWNQTGTWNFTGGVGKTKNKSSIVLTILTETYDFGNSFSNSNTYTGADAPIQVLNLIELKNKEMIIDMNGSSSYNSSGWSYSSSSDNTTAEMTLTQ